MGIREKYLVCGLVGLHGYELTRCREKLSVVLRLFR